MNGCSRTVTLSLMDRRHGRKEPYDEARNGALHVDEMDPEPVHQEGMIDMAKLRRSQVLVRDVGTDKLLLSKQARAAWGERNNTLGSSRPVAEHPLA